MLINKEIKLEINIDKVREITETIYNLSNDKKEKIYWIAVGL